MEAWSDHVFSPVVAVLSVSDPVLESSCWGVVVSCVVTG